MTKLHAEHIDNAGGIQPWSRPVAKRVIYAGGKRQWAPDLTGRYKGVDETCQILALDEYTLQLGKWGSFLRAMELEETVLLLGNYDSRARRAATLCHPITLQEVADLGYFGEIDPAHADLFEGITSHEGKVWTCLSDTHWQKYEALQAQGVDILELGADWANARPLWTCETGVYREGWTELKAPKGWEVAGG